MTEFNQCLLEAMIAGVTLDDLVLVTGLSKMEIYKHLQSIEGLGYRFMKEYFDDGDVVYYQVKNIAFSTDQELFASPLKLIPRKAATIRLLAISDTHFGHADDLMEKMSWIYDYATKNGIHLILHLGDFVEGAGFCKSLQYRTTEEQLAYVLKEYPYDPHINTLILFGNHDFLSLEKEETDISDMISSERCDLISLGYGKKLLQIRKNYVSCFHRLSNLKKPSLHEQTDCLLHLEGHSHYYRIHSYPDGDVVVSVPSFSTIKNHPPYVGAAFPSILDLTLEFELDGKMRRGKSTQIAFLDRHPVPLGEHIFKFPESALSKRALSRLYRKFPESEILPLPEPKRRDWERRFASFQKEKLRKY